MQNIVYLRSRQSVWCASLTLVSGNPMHVTPRQTMTTSKLSVLMKAAYPLSISSSCVALFYCSWNLIRCLWTLRGLPFSTKNNTTASRQIADLSGDVIYLRNVEITPHTDRNVDTLVEVCKGEMDGTFVALRRPKLYRTVRRRHHVDTIRLKEFNNVSAFFKYINTSNK